MKNYFRYYYQLISYHCQRRAQNPVKQLAQAYFQNIFCRLQSAAFKGIIKFHTIVLKLRKKMGYQIKLSTSFVIIESLLKSKNPPKKLRQSYQINKIALQ